MTSLRSNVSLALASKEEKKIAQEFSLYSSILADKDPLLFLGKMFGLNQNYFWGDNNMHHFDTGHNLSHNGGNLLSSLRSYLGLRNSYVHSHEDIEDIKASAKRDLENLIKLLHESAVWYRSKIIDRNGYSFGVSNRQILQDIVQLRRRANRVYHNLAAENLERFEANARDLINYFNSNISSKYWG